jgi:hypothetical protein
MKSKSKEITRVGGIAAIRDNICYMSWNKKVFALLKEDYDKMHRQEERKNNAQMSAIVS